MYKLTHSQMEIWNSQQLYPDSPLCNENISIRIVGELDAGLFEQCWDFVVQTNPVLKTRIEIGDCEPVQFQNAKSPALQQIDFSHSSDPEHSALAWMQSRSATLLDLNLETVTSALLKLGDSEWIWFIQQHHVAVDAWSMTLIWNKLVEFYQSPHLLEQAGNHIDNAYKYCDFLNAYQASNAGNRTEKSNAHWQDRQQADPLALYGRNPIGTSTHSTRVTLQLTDANLEKIDLLLNKPPYKSFNRTLGHYQVFLTMLASWLQLVSNQNNLTINMPNAGRYTKNDKQCIGYFIEILPFHIELDDDSSFQAIYKQVQNESMRSIRHAHNGACQHNDRARPNVFYNYINGSFDDLPGFKTSIDWIYPEHTHPHHALRMHVINWDSKQNPSIALDFNDTWFTDKQRTQALDHFQRVIDRFCNQLDQPDQPISQIALAGRHDLWEITDKSPIHNETNASQQIQLAILAQCDRLEDAIAIKQGPESISYAELKLYTERFVHYLHANGICKGDRVVLHLERDWRILPVILGTLLNGSVYVPIDVNNPSLRIQRIEHNAKPSLVITDPAGFSYFKDSTQCVSIEDIFVAHSDNSSGVEQLYNDNKHDPSAPAYILYTSGSTGEPKGVEISHGSLWRYCAWAKEALYKGHPLSFPFVTSIGFDITNTSLFATCLTGGTLHVYPEQGRSDAVNVLDAIANTDINCLFFTPSQLSLITDQDLSHSKVTQIVSAGEQLKGSLVKRLRQLFTHPVTIYNGYGPTEATILTTFHQCAEGDIDDSPIPIGVPIAGMRSVVLDAAGNPQIQGVDGELYLSGPLLSKGYWQDPTRTRESFVELPVLPGATFYKTGDTVRVNENGILEYLGRNDNQIKRNGIRLELGEIEGAALLHPCINSAVVVARSTTDNTAIKPTDTASQLRLVLYYSGTRQHDSTDLHQHLMKHLPCSAIPDQAIWVEQLPMNPNGKTDFSKLPAPSKNDFFGTESYLAPETKLQQHWQDIWLAILDIDSVSTNDDFFKIGGNSVLAIKLIAEINSLGYQYSPLDIFKNPTIIMLSKLDRKADDGNKIQNTHSNVPFAQISQQELTKLKKLMK